MDAIEYYKYLHECAGKTLAETYSDEETAALHVKSHGYLNDYGVLYKVIAGRHESPVFDLAFKEYQFALLALSSGQYRHAFSGLRLFFELWLSAVYFSGNELDFRLWQRDSKDLNWQRIVNPDNGLLSSTFCKAFNNLLVEDIKPFRLMAEAVYRECSEYVHGNSHTHKELTNEIKFRKAACVEWHEKAKNMHLVILFVFSMRYLNFIDTKDRENIAQIILGELGHITELRSQF